MIFNNLNKGTKIQIKKPSSFIERGIIKGLGSLHKRGIIEPRYHRAASLVSMLAVINST